MENCPAKPRLNIADHHRKSIGVFASNGNFLPHIVKQLFTLIWTLAVYSFYHWLWNVQNNLGIFRSSQTLPRSDVCLYLRSEDFVNNLFTLFVETFESPPKSASAYLDQKTGLFDTLANISAEQASKPISAGGTSIAAQVEHTRFHIDVIEQFIKGRTEKVNWDDSWQVREVTPEAWQQLQQDLKTAYESATETCKAFESWGDDEIGDSLAIVIHTAYHLGALRQIMKVVT